MNLILIPQTVIFKKMGDKENAIKLFEDKRVRVLWDEEQEKWFLSIIDVIEALTGTDRPRKYWSDLKTKLNSERSHNRKKVVTRKNAKSIKEIKE